MLFKKKILEQGACFFDIDGVLNTSSSWGRQYSLRRDLAANLCSFVKERNLDLIMTSSWRIGFISPMDKDNLPQIKQLEKIMAEYGATIKGKTPIFKGKARDLEINRYLACHPYDRVIVIDDDRGEYASLDNMTFLFTDSAKGFDKAALKRAMKLI